MQSKKLAGTKPGPPTQQYLDIAEIKDDTVVLKDGTLRAVLLASSINFALKSEDEQNAIISAYMSFLNSFDFPLQIVIQSRKLEIEAYLEKLKKMEKEQVNDLLRMQIGEYRQYVAELVQLGDIMSKKFYIVVPYNPLSDQKKGFISRFMELFSSAVIVRLERERFLKRKKVLMQRVQQIQMGLSSMGIKTAVLDTQSLIELYYNMYNPQTAEQEKMADLNKLRVEE